DVYWKENYIYNELHFSPFHISLDTIDKYVDRLNKESIRYFHAYPSAIINLMHAMKEKNLKLSYSPKAIFLISENYSIEQVQELDDFFSCKMMSFYGHSERLIFAPTFGDMMTFKHDKRYGFCELVNEQGEVINSDNITGELVGTSYDNWMMPLIRYKTDDYSKYYNSKSAIFTQLEGRWKQEKLIGKNDEEITLTALNMHSKIFANVLNYQYQQIQKGIVKICLIPGKSYSENDKQAILDAFDSKAGHAVEFSIEIVDRMQLTSRGKFQRLIK
ncbi:MAG: hypothetical protein HRT89_24095, partial [Lentisphaeria bacterium]|nr:hypothetical protein [Lentisphaeria bacterium]